VTILKTTSNKYFYSLDSLRFLAFLGVFLCHCVATPNLIPQNSTIAKILYNFCFNGARGVEMFFVISGFIITYLLISEKIKTDQISLKDFYIRRTLRIWPLFYIILIYVFLIKPFLAQHFGLHWQYSFSETYNNNHPNPLMWIFFLGNFDIVLFNGNPPQSELHLLWSLCVEEQFYLFWPLILKFIRVKQIPYVLVFGIFISVICRMIFIKRFQVMESNFDTLILLDFFAIGGLLAYLIINNENGVRTFMNIKIKPFIEWTFLILILFIIAFDTYSNTTFFEISFKYTFYAIVFALLILSFEFKNNTIRVLKKNKILNYLGRISYGLYMYHMLVWTIVYYYFKHWNMGWLMVLIAFMVTILISIASFKFIETPFLNLSKRFRKV
jgi:peptidoglycan/LPS O-acetylase OafA/YrhL